MDQSPIDMMPFNDFESASRAVLQFLHERVKMSLWMMTRTEGNDWIVLQADDRGYGVVDGDVFDWGGSYCSRMVLGNGPRVAPNASDISVYLESAINQQVDIGAYVGAPVHKDDGSLFGTLCAIDPNAKDDTIRSELPTVEILARLLGTVLSTELEAIENRRSLEISQRQATTDHMTGLVSRRGWDCAIETEETKARQFGMPISVLIIDLDDLKKVNDTQGHAKGDELLCLAARALESAVRKNDIVSRLGGDEFGIVAVECGKNDLDHLLERVRSSLAENDVQASVGKATRHPKTGLLEAVLHADKDMYSDKEARRKALNDMGSEFKAV